MRINETLCDFCGKNLQSESSDCFYITTDVMVNPNSHTTHYMLKYPNESDFCNLKCLGEWALKYST